MRARKLTMFLGLLLMCVLLASGSATAFHAAETKTGAIMLSYELPDVRFSLYQVGIITDHGAVCTDAFAKYHVDLNSENATQTLASYILRDQPAPLAEAMTDADGRASFEQLEQAVYLLIGDSTAVGDSVYTVMPSMIPIPFREGTTEHWYVSVKIKYEKSTEKETDVSCLKIWRSADGETVYPAVEVQLLRNGEVYDTVALNAANSWKHTWEHLDARQSWTVTEKELGADYTVDISRDQYLFTITNTVTPPPETTAPTTSTQPTKPTQPTLPTRSTTPTTPSKPPTIPQTGQLNWPIPMLVVTGVSLVLIGFLVMRKNRYEK